MYRHIYKYIWEGLQKKVRNCMILGLERVRSRHAQNHQNRTLQRPRVHSYLPGERNLEGFGHFMMENECLQVDDPWFLTNPPLFNKQRIRSKIKDLQLPSTRSPSCWRSNPFWFFSPARYGWSLESCMERQILVVLRMVRKNTKKPSIHAVTNICLKTASYLVQSSVGIDCSAECGWITATSFGATGTTIWRIGSDSLSAEPPWRSDLVFYNFHRTIVPWCHLT